MLKIKDNVNLKELEKFEFEKNSFANCYLKDISTKYDNNTIFIKKDNRKIIIDHYQDEYGSMDIDNLDTLYDLIKADFIDKVDG